MRVFETIITQGNINNGHIHTTTFADHLPSDVFGDTDKSLSVARKIKLEFGELIAESDIPKGRTFFRNRSFAAELFRQARVVADDTLLLEEVTPYHFRISIRWPCGATVVRRSQNG